MKLTRRGWAVVTVAAAVLGYLSGPYALVLAR